jgi:NitT/TauT family transport system permease protein
MSKTPVSVNPSPDALESAAPRRASNHFALRRPIPRWQSILLGIACILVCLAIWWFITWGEQGETRIVSPLILPSPAETFGSFHDLWFRGQLTRNTLITLRRVALGFLMSLAIGVPLGILAGCFPRVHAFLTPLVMFGRNIPIAALLPLMTFLVRTDFYFNASEWRKIAFIFLATVAFVLADAARAIMDVAERYVDTAYTLGASRWDTVTKVLIPLALPSIFSSSRLMFGIAFGYIMLAESMRDADTLGGLGYQIFIAQKRTYPEQVYLIILIIPLVALAIDQLLYWVQRSLFPYQYGGDGLMNKVVRWVLQRWDQLKRAIFGSRESDAFLRRYAQSSGQSPGNSPRSAPLPHQADDQEAT